MSLWCYGRNKTPRETWYAASPPATSLSKYGKSAAQVALRWLTQRGVVAIPKSTHKERMAQNLDVFDFRLTDSEMAQIAKLNQHDTGTINFGDPQFVKHLIENYG